MKRRRLVLWGLFFLVVAGMAYFLQDLVRSALFVPISYMWWGMYIMYQSVAQLVYWVILVVGITLMAFGSLYGRERSRKVEKEETVPQQGPLESTARQISQTSGGVYYKWLIANRMGKLASSILSLRDGRAIQPHSPLAGRDWNPPDEVEAYFDSGLTRTFADFPRQGRFYRPPQTPFDTDINKVIVYLESQMENQRD